MSNFKRAMHFDFHTMPGIPHIFGNFDADRFAKTLSENHVEYINFVARCNIGFSYYNTKVGKKYPGLKRDMLREVLTACHKKNIGVTAYLNAGLNHEYGADHPEVCAVNKDGTRELDDKYNNFYRIMCYNTAYRDRLLSEIKEIVKYDIDGLFCDCMFVPRVCYCPLCVADMKKRGLNPDSEEDGIFYQKTLRKEVCREIKKIAGPKIRTYFNGVPWDESLHSHAELECLTAGKMWGHDYFYASAPYAETRFKELVFMTGRFMDDWGDFGGITSEKAMMNDLYDAMMHGFGLSFGDHMHPIDGVENEVITRVGRVFAEKMRYEPFTENARTVAEVGVFVRDKDDIGAPKYLIGVSKILNELKIPFHIYNEEGDFTKCKLLILPVKLTLSDVFCEKLTSYLQSGGKLLFAGEAIDNALDLHCDSYFTSCGADPADNAYFTLDGDMRWAMYRTSHRLINKSGKEIADYYGNIFNYGYDGRQYYFYKPQGTKTEHSTALSDGNTAVICFDVFNAYADTCLPEHRTLVKRVIDELMPERFITVKDIPIYALLSVTENELNRIVHIKSDFAEAKCGRGVIEDDVWIKGGTVSVCGNYDVFTLPDMTPVSAVTENGRTVFATGEICGYKAFSLRKK